MCAAIVGGSVVAEIALGDDVDVRAGVADSGTAWAVIDDGYHFDGVARLDDAVLATASGQRRDRRWYRSQGSTWSRIPGPQFPAGPDVHQYYQGDDVRLAESGGAIVALSVETSQAAITIDGLEWELLPSVPHDTLRVDMSSEAIVVAGQEKASVLLTGRSPAGWSPLQASGHPLVASVVGTGALVSGGDGWALVDLVRGDVAPVRTPTRPAGCTGSGRPEMAPDLSRDVHVVVVGCGGVGQTVLTSTDGVVFSPLGTVAERFSTPSFVVRDEVFEEVVAPDVSVNGRSARFNTSFLRDDGAIVVMMSDPGKSTGFYCC